MAKIINKLVLKMLTFMIPFPFKRSHCINCVSKQILYHDLFCSDGTCFETPMNIYNSDTDWCDLH